MANIKIRKSHLNIREGSDYSSGSDEISSGSSNISRSGSSTDIYEDECYNPLAYIHEGLTFLYTNADNLINKMDELRARVVVTNPDIIIITEVYPKTCDSTITLPVELDITGYICFRSNVMKSSRGVVIYVKDIISAERRDNLSDSNFLESVWVDVNINKQDKILIGGIYRSPNSEHDNTQILFDLINSACLSFFLSFFLYILPGARFRALSAGVHCTLRGAG